MTTQLAFDAGASLGTLLSGRFWVAAAILSPVVWLRRAARPVKRQVLAAVAEAIDVPAGRQPVREGADAGAYFMIERGRASVTRDERCIADLGPGQFFGEVALLDGDPRTASVVAATDMHVRVVPQREFAKAMQKLPTLARCVRKAATDRIAAPPPRLAVAA